MNVFRLIDTEKANYSVTKLCRMLEVSKSGSTPGAADRLRRGVGKTTPLPRRFARSIAGAARPTATRGYMRSFVPSGSIAAEGEWRGGARAEQVSDLLGHKYVPSVGSRQKPD